MQRGCSIRKPGLRTLVCVCVCVFHFFLLATQSLRDAGGSGCPGTHCSSARHCQCQFCICHGHMSILAGWRACLRSPDLHLSFLPPPRSEMEAPTNPRSHACLPDLALPVRPPSLPRGPAVETEAELVAMEESRSIVQKGLTAVQEGNLRPRWGQAFAFVVSSRHQVGGWVGLQRGSQQGGWGGSQPASQPTAHGRPRGMAARAGSCLPAMPACLPASRASHACQPCLPAIPTRHACPPCLPSMELPLAMAGHGQGLAVD